MQDNNLDWPRLRKLSEAKRKALGWTQKRASLAVGFRTPATYCYFESGEGINVSNFLLVCSWLKEDPLSFLILTREELIEERRKELEGMLDA